MLTEKEKAHLKKLGISFETDEKRIFIRTNKFTYISGCVDFLKENGFRMLSEIEQTTIFAGGNRLITYHAVMGELPNQKG